MTVDKNKALAIIITIAVAVAVITWVSVQEQIGWPFLIFSFIERLFPAVTEKASLREEFN